MNHAESWMVQVHLSREQNGNWDFQTQKRSITSQQLGDQMLYDYVTHMLKSDLVYQQLMRTGWRRIGYSIEPVVAMQDAS